MKILQQVITLLSLIALLFFGCGINKDNKIYVPGKTFTYNVYEITAEKDTTPHIIRLVVKSLGFPQTLFDQTPIEYHYTDIKRDGKVSVERTGISESKERISIHPPRMNYMAFAEIPPQPSVNLPLSVGTSRDITLEVVKGWDSLNNQTIKQHEKVIAKEDIELEGKQYKGCLVTEGSNVSHIEKLGRYSMKYWFHNDYGFVKMVYTKPDGARVVLNLKEVR